MTEEQVQELILSRTNSHDDADFWRTALATLLHDAQADIAEAPSKADVYAQIGACSHWLRPHQTRWTADGGFAYPTGYGASGYSRIGLPQFDWSVLLRWNRGRQSWEAQRKYLGKRRFVFRAALPTRTVRHAQAAIHTVWLPTNLTRTEPKVWRLYGFRKINGVWQCVANT
jgi:hypothetical protein